MEPLYQQVCNQYQGVWSIMPEYMPESVGYGQASNIRIADPIANARTGVLELQRQGNVAIIEIRGVMSKYGSWFSSLGSTLLARRRIAAALDDDSINSILLLIESPGGAVSGNLELAEAVAAANKVKPVHAYIEDLGASAAYEVASQADVISSNKSALVGSIGTYMVAYDFKGMLDDMGIKAHLIKEGEFKGAGTLGTEITEKQIEHWQSLVTKMNDQFVQAVADGRGITMQQARKLADGRVHMAEDALALGLVDHVEGFAAAMDRLQSSNQSSEVIMTDTTITAPEAPKAATLAQLKAACPGANNDFLMTQLEAEATVEQAKDSFMLALQQDRDTARQEAEEAAKKAAEDAAAKAEADAEAARLKAVQDNGNQPITGDGSESQAAASNDPATAWNQLVQSKRDEGMNVAQSLIAAKKENEKLYYAYMDSKEVMSIKPREPVSAPSGPQGKES